MFEPIYTKASYHDQRFCMILAGDLCRRLVTGRGDGGSAQRTGPVAHSEKGILIDIHSGPRQREGHHLLIIPARIPPVVVSRLAAAIQHTKLMRHKGIIYTRQGAKILAAACLRMLIRSSSHSPYPHLPRIPSLSLALRASPPLVCLEV